MNEMENFLNFCAVIKLRRGYDDELSKFIELMKSVGFLQEYAEHFEKSCCFDKEFKEFSEDVFWYNVKKMEVIQMILVLNFNGEKDSLGEIEKSI